MISCNFPVLEAPIELDSLSNILVIKSKEVYSQIVYSLYQRESGYRPDYPFLLFDGDFKEFSDVTVIQNPLTFSFDTANFKKLLFQRIIATLDMEERAQIEASYAGLVQYFNQQIFEDIEISVSISEAYKLEDLFKLLKITILDDSSSIFERAQLILNVLHELTGDELIIFCGLGSWMSLEEYNLIVETATLNQQRVLFLENSAVGKVENGRLHTLDEDFSLWEG